MTDRERSLRHQRILALFDQRVGPGLEIGPLFDPVVRRWDGDVRYVDVKSGAELKEYYSAHPDVPIDDIVDPDFTLVGPNGMRTLPEAVQGADPFRWVIASHVIEHVPDMIGWLDEVGQILADDGLLVLAIPDRRFSFDAARPPTTVGEMLLANRNRDMVPSVRAIYDHYTSVVSINAVDAWQGHEPGLNDRIHGLDYVRSQLRQAVEDGVYVDCHVWLFTPQSFVDQLAELAQLDRLDFVVDRVVPTATNELEFYAVLRRLGREVTADQRSAALATGFIETGLDGPTALRSAASTGSLDHGPLPRTEILSPREWQLVHTKRELMSRWRRVVGGMRTWPKSLVRRSADRR